MITDSVKEYIKSTSSSIMANEIRKLAISAPVPCTPPPCNSGTGSGGTGGSVPTPTIVNLNDVNALLDIYREYVLDTIDVSVEFVNSPEFEDLNSETIDAIIASTVLADLKDPTKTSILSNAFEDFIITIMLDPTSSIDSEKALAQKLMLDSRHNLFFGEETARLFDNIHQTINEVVAIDPGFNTP